MLQRLGHYASALNRIFNWLKWEEGAQFDFSYADDTLKIFSASSSGDSAWIWQKIKWIQFKMEEFVSPCNWGSGVQTPGWVRATVNPVKDDSIIPLVLCCDHLSFTSNVRSLAQRLFLMGGRWKMSLWSLKWACIEIYCCSERRKPLTGISAKSLQGQDQPTVMVDLPAYFPYFSNRGFTIFFWATICTGQDKREPAAPPSKEQSAGSR